MKALSLLQLWASLVVLGHKKIETRSWNTKHRGPLLIHASMGTQKAIRRYLKDEPFRSCLREKMHIRNVIETHWDIPRGAIIGMVEILGTCSTNWVSTQEAERIFMLEGCPPSKNYPNGSGNILLTPQEAAFGDYSPGRFGWLLAKPLLFPEPIPCRGSLSIWNVPEELHSVVNLQIQKATGRP